MAMVLTMPRMPTIKAIADVPRQQLEPLHELVIAGALDCRLCAQAGQSDSICAERVLDSVGRFAGWSGAKPDMKARDLADQAGELLQLIERHDYRSGFKSSAAVKMPATMKPAP